MQLVDTARYPLDRLNSDEGHAFVSTCARSYADAGTLVLPGFLTNDAVGAIAAEATAKTASAFFCRNEHTVFLGDGRLDGPDNDDPDNDDSDNDDFDAADVGRRTLHTRVGSIANDMLDPTGALQRLYQWAPLTSFIGAVIGHDSFHRGEDPLGALSINVYGPGDLHEWHFDESRFSVTIMIQEAAQGGHFEFIDGLRSDDHVDAPGIQRILDGDETGVQRLAFDTGSLSIFGGRNTLHRVTEVAGDQHRLVPVLTYGTVPGSANSDAVRELFWGRSA